MGVYRPFITRTIDSIILRNIRGAEDEVSPQQYTQQSMQQPQHHLETETGEIAPLVETSALWLTCMTLLYLSLSEWI